MERNPMAASSDGAQEWLHTMRSLAEQIQKQQATSQEMVQELMNTYMQLLNTPGAYVSGQAEQQQQTLQQVSQQWVEQAQRQQQTFQQQAQQQQQAFQQLVQESMSTYAKLFDIPLQYAQQGLESASFPISNYDDLTVEDIKGQLGGLSTDDVRTVRDYEERTHKRDTLLEQLDRRIRSSS